uniref:GDT1 family protein n=1 Tax=Tetranychus urticae TaxID=32264 RepID=T1K737_TETUR
MAAIKQQLTVFNNESHSLVEGFSQALLIVTVSELGDKTFIITAIMAMKYPKHYILIGALSAEYIMVTFSCKYININAK